ncbi:hypothetical protein Cgig2_013267 [Carnegiea gigantea]|uniref:Uncharacterized protein n=1 Tax=Carnegiea gigantea TaxID=171969 RepID=A0A9Q1K351_9CARY|nr:hypothetical protein Cgig2_013267 [Carnegiea gigantea]
MDSMISTNYKNKRVYSVTRNEFSSEDSGWSLYIKDSVASSNMKDASLSSGSEFSSMFSDAGSLPKKIYAGDGYATSTRSISKRRKTEETFVDDDLEDTASSPICNSEVYDLEKLLVKVRGNGYDLNMLKDVDQLSEYDNTASSQVQYCGSAGILSHLRNE